MIGKPFKWQARGAWYFYYIGSDGKRHRKRLAETKDAAFEEWRKIVDASQTNDDMPAEALVWRYLSHLKREVQHGRKKPETVTRRTEILMDWARAFQGQRVGDIKAHHVTGWLDKKTTWNATTQNTVLAAVKRCFAWAVAEELISRNPAEKISRPPGGPREFVIDRATHEALCESASDRVSKRKTVRAFRTFLIAAHLSGARPGLLCAVDVSHVADNGARWIVPEHKRSRKKKRPQIVYCGPCLQTLTRILARGRVKGGRRSGPLLRPGKGRAWKYSELRRRFSRCRDRANVPAECVLYSYRHSWITDTLVAGVDIATTAELAGTSVRMIEQHYGHLSQRHDHLSDAALRAAAKRQKERPEKQQSEPGKVEERTNA